MVANVNFLRKLASDELRDTVFFATGQVPSKERDPKFVILKADWLNVKIFTNRNITVNGNKCKSVYEAKVAIQQLIA
jgi:hypothetical protein